MYRSTLRPLTPGAEVSRLPQVYSLDGDQPLVVFLQRKFQLLSNLIFGRRMVQTLLSGSDGGCNLF